MTSPPNLGSLLLSRNLFSGSVLYHLLLTFALLLVMTLNQMLIRFVVTLSTINEKITVTVGLSPCESVPEPPQKSAHNQSCLQTCY